MTITNDMYHHPALSDSQIVIMQFVITYFTLKSRTPTCQAISFHMSSRGCKEMSADAVRQSIAVLRKKGYITNIANYIEPLVTQEQLMMECMEQYEKQNKALMHLLRN